MKIPLFTFIAFFAAAMAVQAADKIRVSAFSTILTEIAQQVGGDRVAVTGHVKAGVDPHEFEPKPEDLKIVGDAQLILLSAKHMESYVGKLKEATGTKGELVEVGDGFTSLKMKSEKDPDKVIEDPHWWQSVLYTEKAVKIVRDELIKVSPADKATFTENAAKYLAKLDALEKWVKVELAKLPRDKRKLVTSHDAFQYFARDNGFTIHAIEGISSEDQPSSKKVGDIVAAIKSEGVKAIFPENIENPKVMTEITRETGVKIAPPLYADGLGDTPEASTYEAMYKHNVTTIVDALK
jgi:ABC-type Zn uptake system ZnuABC Zn-binding protein ZnuA